MTLTKNDKAIKSSWLQPKVLAVIAGVMISIFGITSLVAVASSQCRPLDIDIELMGVKTQLYLGDCSKPK